MKKCKFVVRYGSHVARFSSEQDARDFGKAMSAPSRLIGHLVEMSDKTGLIGQWRDGKATAEFAHTERKPAAPVQRVSVVDVFSNPRGWMK